MGREGGQRTVDLAFVDERGLYASCLLLVMKWSKDLHTYYLPAEHCGGVAGDTPDDTRVDRKCCRSSK